MQSTAWAFLSLLAISLRNTSRRASTRLPRIRRFTRPPADKVGMSTANLPNTTALTQALTSAARPRHCRPDRRLVPQCPRGPGAGLLARPRKRRIGSR